MAKYRLPVSEAYNSIKFLEKEGYIELTEEINNPSRVNFIVSRDDLYRFQVANATLDGFIKLILRSYTGLFTEFVPVNEEMISKKSGLTRDQVYKYFVLLSKQNIIRYIPGKKSALVIFTEERLDRKSLMISPSNYNEVKEKFEIRLERLLEYVTSTTRCRPSILLDYFGQDSSRCGKCDICISRNELDMSKYEFDLVLDKIKDALEGRSLDVKGLLSLLDGDESENMKVVRWLLDHDKILKCEDNRLVWSHS
ncbi:MAG: RecQ family zinc-binding domain-containing protein [Bacteroidales bacterium]